MRKSKLLTLAFALAALLLALAIAGSVAAKSSKKKAKPKPVGARITRGPYLQQPNARSMIVVWQTSKSTGGSVRYGQSDIDDHAKRSGKRGTFHAVTIKGLAPNTDYKYRVVSGASRTSITTFTTAPTGSEPFSFGVIGDYGTGSSAEYKNAKLLGQEGVRFIMTVGDNIYGNGYQSEYDRGLFNPFHGVMRRTAFYPSLGNHDYGNDNGKDGIQRENASAYFHNFVLPKQPAQERYYSFRYGNAEFWAMNTESGDYHPGSEQYAWLKRTLEASDACWKVVYTHQPPYSSTASRVNLRSTIVPLAEKNGVQIVFSGDQHQYERSVPLIAGKQDDQSGITYVVTGGGGASLKPFPDDFPPAWSIFRRSVFQHMLVSVDGSKMNVRAIDTNGRDLDQFSLGCGGADNGLQSGGTSSG